MMPRTAIAQIAKMIGQELDTGVGPSEEALAAGPILADAGATFDHSERFSEPKKPRKGRIP